MGSKVTARSNNGILYEEARGILRRYDDRSIIIENVESYKHFLAGIDTALIEEDPRKRMQVMLNRDTTSLVFEHNF